jgi:hypothetical protein
LCDLLNEVTEINVQSLFYKLQSSQWNESSIYSGGGAIFNVSASVKRSQNRKRWIGKVIICICLCGVKIVLRASY